MTIEEKQKRVKYLKEYWKKYSKKSYVVRRQRYAANKKRISVYDKKYAATNGRTIAGRIRSWRGGAKRRGIQFTLTVKFLETIPLICYYTGRKLTLKANKFNTVSLDRLNSDHGYTEDNVVFCCQAVNKMKLNLSVNEFVNVCRDVVFRYT